MILRTDNSAMLTALVIIIIVVAALYVLSTCCRKGHPGIASLRGWAFAHRGLHGGGIPENSMAAFRRAKEQGYGAELDVHLLSDGELAVIHDASLLRTAGENVMIEDLSVAELSRYHLEGTEETIPTFHQVLELFAGERPLIIELKAERGNHDALCRKTCEMLDDYVGAYCIESFDPRCVLWLRKNRPDVIRGQLTENYFKSKSRLPAVLKFALQHQIMNILTYPDFVAYRFSDRHAVSNKLVRSLWGAQGVTWTLRSQEEYNAAVAEGWIPIFEGFSP